MALREKLRQRVNEAEKDLSLSLSLTEGDEKSEREGSDRRDSGIGHSYEAQPRGKGKKLAKALRHFPRAT